MTPQELRQLDLRMAELCGLKLMTRRVRNWFWRETERYWLCPDGRELRYTDWHPTCNIAQALGDGGPGTVMGEMKDRGYNLDLLSMHISKTWAARFILFDADRTVAWKTASWGSTPSIAICLAAQQAIEQEKKEAKNE